MTLSKKVYSCSKKLLSISYLYYGRCLLLLQHIRSTHLKILRFRMGGAYKYRDIFARFKTMWSKQILASALGIQKQN